jgi:hypothetical protein
VGEVRVPLSFCLLDLKISLPFINVFLKLINNPCGYEDLVLNRYAKGKVVPQHTYECTGGRCIAPTHSRRRHEMGVSGQRHAPAALYLRGKDPGTHCTGSWVGPRG